MGTTGALMKCTSLFFLFLFFLGGGVLFTVCSKLHNSQHFPLNLVISTAPSCKTELLGKFWWPTLGILLLTNSIYSKRNTPVRHTYRKDNTRPSAGKPSKYIGWISHSACFKTHLVCLQTWTHLWKQRNFILCICLTRILKISLRITKHCIKKQPLCSINLNPLTPISNLQSVQIAGLFFTY